MRESFQTEMGYLPGLVWVYDGRHIYLASLPQFQAEQDALRAQLDNAARNGFHTDDTWAYWAAQGGQHMLSMRSVPEVLMAPDLKAALAAALASLQTAR
jgi:hypothetical protein